MRIRPALPRAGTAAARALDTEIGDVGTAWAVFEGGVYVGTISHAAAFRAQETGWIERIEIVGTGLASCGCDEDEADHVVTDYTGSDIDTVIERWRCATCGHRWERERFLSDIQDEELEHYAPYYMADQ